MKKEKLKEKKKKKKRKERKKKQVEKKKSYVLTLKTPRKPASENVVYLGRLLNILANFSSLFLHTGKQCGLRSDCSSDPCPHCLQK